MTTTQELQQAQDRTTEALRRAFVALPRYSFLLDKGNNVRCVQDQTGEWVNQRVAHALFDPVNVDRLLCKPRKPAVTKAATDVLAERERQVTAEGWTPEHDDQHGRGSMAYAAAAYAVSSVGQTRHSFFIVSLWAWTGWAPRWFKPKDSRSDLVKAGALILAEIERIDRARGVE